MKRFLVLFLTLALCIPMFASTTALADSKSLTVYTAFPEAEVIYYFDKFTEETGITVNYIRLSAGEMLTRVAAEKDNPLAALMVGGSTDNYIAAAEQGLLEPYQSPELAATPEAYLDPTGTWNPVYVGAIAFACNKEWFADKGYDYPTTWADLLDPKYQGEIIMAHPATSGTAYTVLATIIQLMGDDAAWEYLAQLDTNMSQYTKSGAAAPNAVALGEAAIALTFSHDGLQPTAEGYPIELSFPTDGTGYEVGAVALIKNGPADEQENAKLFIDWMCSTAGQNCYAENDSFRVPTNTEAVAAEGLVTLDKVQTIEYDAVWAASVKKDYTATFEEKITSAPEA
ncbi:MAG: ABC transporter substrate-binding protein [Clostridia bacterium]|nr:ABC transporter substrate-binding protein [Clostridia bacterium]